MPLSDHFVGMTQRVASRIITVDPATHRLEAITRDGAVVQVEVGNEISGGFTWPEVNETWYLYRQNISWILGGRVPDSEDRLRISDLQPGESLSARKYVVTVGNGTLSIFTIIHGLSTLDIASVTARTTAAAPYTILPQTYTILDNKSISVTFTSPPSVNGARITVLG